MDRFVAVILLVASVSAECPLKNVCPKMGADANNTCMTALFHPQNFLKVGFASGFLYTSMGEQNFCEDANYGKLTGGLLEIPAMEMCNLVLHDGSGEFVIQDHGICAPKGCNGGPVGELVADVAKYFNTTTCEGRESAPECLCSPKEITAVVHQQIDCYQEAYTESCGVAWDATFEVQMAKWTACVATGTAKGSCCMPWKAFTTIMQTTAQGIQGFASFGPIVHGLVGFHCGNFEYKPFSKDAGGSFMLAVTVALVLISVTSWLVLTGRCGVGGGGGGGGGFKGLSINSGDTVAAGSRSGDYDDDAEGLLPASADQVVALAQSEVLKQAKAEVAKIEGEMKKADRMTVMKAFDPQRNLSSLFEVSPTRTIGGLDCMKAISMFWIILGHSALLSNLIGESDPHLLSDWEFKSGKHAFANMFTAATDKAVDTFFLVGGLLMAYTTIGKIRKKDGSVNMAKCIAKVPLFTFIRFLRLVPLYAFVIFFYGTIFPHMGSGPLWWKVIEESGLCRKKWWQNLLFINNFSPTNFHDQCMSWTWYLANDMQFFVVGLFVLMLYGKSRTAAHTMIAAVFLLSNGLGYYILESQPSKYQDHWYDKPWMRISPMLIGMAIGLAMKDTNLKKWKLSKLVAASLMVLSILSITFVIYIQYSQFHPYPTSKSGIADGNGNWTPAANAAYLTWGRMLFVFAIATIIILGMSNNGGVVYGFLTLPCWEPLGKLTYGAYLVHPIVLRGLYFQMDHLFQWDTWLEAFVFTGCLTISYLLSAGLHVLVELPFANLVGLMLRGKAKKPRA